MAPILYDYCKMPMDDIWKEDGDKRCKLVVGILGLLVIVLLGVLLIFFIIKANSEACQDGLRAVMECRNVTYLLQQELAEAQRGFRDAEAQAVTCNQTVMALMASLDAEKAQGRKKVEELEGEITTLNHKLQDASAEVERLRSEITFPATLHPPHSSHPHVPTSRPRISPLLPKSPLPQGKRKPRLKRENRGHGLRQLPRLQLRGRAPAPDSAAGLERSAAVRSQEAGISWKIRFLLDFSPGHALDLISSERVMGQHG
uniref:Bone marrow stromal antigen 2 n=1 Tax=Macaca fascicularis TaxID=9541 RepID=A0A2K5U138_MACFA